MLEDKYLKCIWSLYGKGYHIAGNFQGRKLLWILRFLMKVSPWNFGAAKATNPRKFSLWKLYFSPIRESFSLESFPLYSILLACFEVWSMHLASSLDYADDWCGRSTYSYMTEMLLIRAMLEWKVQHASTVVPLKTTAYFAFPSTQLVWRNVNAPVNICIAQSHMSSLTSIFMIHVQRASEWQHTECLKGLLLSTSFKSTQAVLRLWGSYNCWYIIAFMMVHVLSPFPSSYLFQFWNNTAKMCLCFCVSVCCSALKMTLQGYWK